jgi:hypothetical protein
MEDEIKRLKDEILGLRRNYEDLRREFYRTNFNATDVFLKKSSYTQIPASAAVFEFRTNAVDPTGAGGAAAGRIPITIAGTIKYLPYY